MSHLLCAHMSSRALSSYAVSACTSAARSVLLSCDIFLWRGSPFVCAQGSCHTAASSCRQHGMAWACKPASHGGSSAPYPPSGPRLPCTRPPPTHLPWSCSSSQMASARRSLHPARCRMVATKAGPPACRCTEPNSPATQSAHAVGGSHPGRPAPAAPCLPAAPPTPSPPATLISSPWRVLQQAPPPSAAPPKRARSRRSTARAGWAAPGPGPSP